MVYSEPEWGEFTGQCQDPVKTDWVNTVKQGLIELDINMTFDDIKNLSKAKFNKVVKDKVQKKALEFLANLQKTHSKSKNLHYNSIAMQDYLRSNNSNH